MLAKIQAFMLDALAPLTAILENSQGEATVDATKAAMQLIGNASAKMAHLRCKKIVANINQALMLVVDDDTNFKTAPPLFGTEFAKISKDHIDQVKAMRSTLPKTGSTQGSSSFFRNGPPSSRGAGQEKQLPQVHQGRRPAAKGKRPHYHWKNSSGTQGRNPQNK